MATRKMSSFFRKMIGYILIWMVAWLLFNLIKYMGTDELPAFEKVLSIKYSVFIFNSAIFSVFIGVPFTIVDELLDHPSIRKKSYSVIIIIKTLSQLIITFLSYLLLIIIIIKFRYIHEYTNIDEVYRELVVSNLTILVLIYSLLTATLIHFFQMMERKVGGRVLLNLLIGKYHFPREERRIFMFLDLKSSTTIAEKLGHIKFSSLIQDCFNDLTDTIVKHDVEVYQYVGDEAILTWKVKDGMRNGNCLQSYFSFRNKLVNRRSYYESKYGVAPFFKAGVHFGLVTVTEVGIIKREIAYHSDVLNTAARIQSMCNDFNAPLLLSKDLKKEFDHDKSFTFHSIGEIELRGKESSVHIYSCEKIADQ